MATDDDLGRFLLDQLPAEAQESLRRLARLRYPVPDRRALAEQLGGDDEVDRRVGSGLLAVFRPEDFGLDTLQGALEKYRQRAPWTLAAALGLDDGARRTLEGALSGGGLRVEGTSIVARMPGGAGVEVSCACTDPDAGGTGASGTCNIVVSGGFLFCTNGTCTKTCGLTVSIPSIGLAIA
jgi:hypothetical protein